MCGLYQSFFVMMGLSILAAVIMQQQDEEAKVVGD